MNLYIRGSYGNDGRTAAESPTMDSEANPGAGGHVPFALGGPVYFPDFVGSITTPREFQNAVIQELTV